MKWAAVLLFAYLNAQFPIKYAHLRIENIDKKQDAMADTLEWDIESGYINRILDSIDLFKQERGVGPEISEDTYNMLMNLDLGNKTRFLNIYGIQYPEMDPIFPPRVDTPLPVTRRGVYNETAWLASMPVMIQLLLRSNATADEVFKLISPQRAAKLTTILQESFPASELQKLGPMPKEKQKKAKIKLPRIPPFLLMGMMPLEMVFAALMIAQNPSMLLPEPEDPESDETEDEDGNPISRKDKKSRPPKPRTAGNSLCTLMRALNTPAADLVSKNVTLTKNETDLLMDLLNDDDIKNFDYAKGKPDKVKNRVLEIFKTEVKKTPLPPVDPKVGCRVRELIEREFRRANGAFSLRPGAKVPLAIRALMKATDRIDEREAAKIRDILNSPNKLGGPKKDFQKRKLPLIMNLLAQGVSAKVRPEDVRQLEGKVAVRVQQVLGSLPPDRPKHRLAFRPEPFDSRVKRIISAGQPLQRLDAGVDGRDAVAIKNLLSKKLQEVVVPHSEEAPASQQAVLKYLSQFDTPRRRPRSRSQPVQIASAAHDVQMLI